MRTSSLCFLDGGEVCTDGWIFYRSGPSGWCAVRAGPCGGEPLRIFMIHGMRAPRLTLDCWDWFKKTRSICGAVAFRRQISWGDVLKTLGEAEKRDLMRRSGQARPGASGWKLAFLKILPPWGKLIGGLLICSALAASWSMRPRLLFKLTCRSQLVDIGH